MGMDPDRWQRVDALFHRALETDPADRPALLDAIADDDADLRQEVEALLRAHDADVPLLDHGPEALVSVLDHEMESAVGRRVGRWRTVRELGHGGMGIVWPNGMTPISGRPSHSSVCCRASPLPTC